jgi:hypothetical protein
MIAATCCRCERELDKKGGVLLRAPEGAERRVDGLLGDDVVKHHLCAACMAGILEWLKVNPNDVPAPAPATSEKCATCNGSGSVTVGNERTTHTQPCPTCTNPFVVPSIPSTKDGDWATVEAARALAEVVSHLEPPPLTPIKVQLVVIDAIAAQFRTAFERGCAQPTTRDAANRGRLTKIADLAWRLRLWAEESMRARANLGPEERESAAAELGKAGAYGEAANEVEDVGRLCWADFRPKTTGHQENPPAPPTPAGHTTTHVLFEGHPLCGFMAGTLPSGWPDGHNWVSIVEVVEHEPGVLSIPTNETCRPCVRCVSLASASTLSRSHA